MGKGINHIKSLTEDFSYLDFNSGTNILNRLRSSAVNSSTSMIAHYAPNGNILAKSNAGDYLYKYSSAKPHAVEVVTNPDGTISNVTQNIYYSPFNKVDSIKENNYKLTYTYGPDQQRRKSILTTNNLLLTTIYYSGNYEKLEIGGNIYEVHYITSPAGLIAINVRHNNTDQLYYVYTDHLGSILTLTDDAGNKVYEQNFDAWGRERNPSDWTYTASTYTKPEWLIRGYTGHEHLDEFALINMNGRCYDPVLGRMLSPDNYVQGATGTQGYNRYTYALNNPLVYTDPDGEFVFLGLPTLFWAITATIAVGGTMQLSGATSSQIYNTVVPIALSIATAGIPSSIAASGGFFANTIATIVGSTINTVSRNIVTGGESDVEVAFGAASYNFTTGKFGYLGKQGNSTLENIGYGFGAFTNATDIWASLKGSYNSSSSLELQTDMHSQTYNPETDETFSWGAMRTDGSRYVTSDMPISERLKYAPQKLNPVTDYSNGEKSWLYRTVRVDKVNIDSYNRYIQNLPKKEQFYRFTTLFPIKGMHCTIATSRALLAGGVFNIPIARMPWLLDLQMRVRNYTYLSYNLNGF